MSSTRLLRFGAAAALVTAILVFPPHVAAHAELESTTPADGATVEGTPTEISATFSEALEDGSSLSLRDATGDEAAKGERDADDPTRLVIDAIPDLDPGEYEVRWTASSDDGHLERGTWSFTVTAPPTPSPTPPPTATAAPSASPAPSPSPTATAVPTPSVAPSPTATPGDDPAGMGSDVLVPIVAGLAVVGIAGGFLLSRRRRA